MRRSGPRCAPVVACGRLILGVEERRRFVLELRLAGTWQKVTAAILGVSQPTVSRDLAYWRRHPATLSPPKDPAVVIGETVALCEEVRVLALSEHARLTIDPAAAGPAGTEARLECLRVAVAAQRLQVKVLQATGLLGVGVAQQAPEEMTANAIAARLKAAGVVAKSA